MKNLLRINCLILIYFLTVLFITQFTFAEINSSMHISYFDCLIQVDSIGVSKQIKSCQNNDLTYLFEIKQKREILLKDVENLRKFKNEIEDDIIKYGRSVKDLKARMKDVEHDLKRAEKDLDKLNKKMNSIMEKVEFGYLDDRKENIRFIGDVTIEPDERINSNICSINGNVLVKGTVNGDFAVINGKISLIDNGKIKGKVVLINSELYADSINKAYDNIVCGEIKEYGESSDYFDFSRRFNRGFDFRFPDFHIPHTDYIDDGVVKYNRVEGLYFGLRSSKKYYWNERKKYSFYGSLGYGFGNHRWSGNIGFDRWIGNENRTEFGIEGHSIIDSKDNWLINPLENSLSAFIIHEDFKDYFMREGWNAHVAQYINKSTRVRADYVEDHYKSLPRNTDWALFGGKKTFRDNPRINDGILKSIIFSINHNTVDNKKFLLEGWDISSSYEISSGAYKFSRLFIDARRYQPIESDHAINMRVILGSSEKFLPVQKSFDLGGLGTIPALRFKEEMNGNRLILCNLEYIMGFEDIFAILFDNEHDNKNGNNLIFFYDAGWLNSVPDDYTLFNGFEINDNFKHDAGIALGFDRNSFRIGLAFRLDKSEPVTFFFRISRPF